MHPKRCQVHLDATSQDAGCHLLIKAGIFLTVCHKVTQLCHQQEIGVVLVHSFRQCFLCADTTHHYCTVFVGGGQTMQETDKFLYNLKKEMQQLVEDRARSPLRLQSRTHHTHTQTHTQRVISDK